jgi:O-antigen/teichoic acid export membrane protein
LFSLQRNFLLNVGIATIGAVGAQAISMIFVPILARLYGPEAWGALGTVVAIVSLVAPIAALSYPIAIILPELDRDAIALVKVSLGSATATTLLALTAVLVVWIAADFIEFELPVSPPLLLVIPFAILFLSLTDIATQWLIREHRFVAMAKAQVGASLFVNLLRAVIGLLSPTVPFLLCAYGTGTAIQSGLIALGARKSMRAKWSYHSTRELILAARLNLDFVVYRTPQVLINSLSQGLPTIVLATWYGSTAAGFFAMSTTILAIPTLLMGKAVSDVFYPQLTKAHQVGQRVGPMLISTTALLLVIGIAPFGLVMAKGPDLFRYILGEEWRMAGQYAQWLSLWLLMGFINRACVAAIPVLNLQRAYLLFEIASVLTRVGVLAAGLAMQVHDVELVAAFSVTSAALNLMLVLATMVAGWQRDRHHK